MRIEDMYFKGELKCCRNCAFYSRWALISKCNLHPPWTTLDAMDTCKYQEWIPNQRLYDKKENQ